MSVLVNIQNEQEEKVLLAFLDSLRYQYKADVADDLNAAYLDQYNREIDAADAEVEAGNFVKHSDVQEFFKNRRKAI